MSVSTQQEFQTQERRSRGVLAAGTAAEGIAGIGAIVLAIIGLANTLPNYMLPIATIAVGAALLFEGGAVTARYTNLLTSARGRVDMREFGIGMTTELLGGGVGLVLGILALIGIFPLVLVPVAAIVFGASLILGTGVTSHLNSLWTSATEEREMVREVTKEAIAAAAGVQFLVGLGAITLGILALIGINPMALSLVAMLSLGFSDLLSGTAIMSRIMGISKRHSV
ncbi:MAG: hypothetical protein M1510_11275 [Nitrospirae bacterium]|nr:hypothetical protein [Nitrospirota bacterium]